MYERILVPLDGSVLAEVTLPYAEELASRLGSEVILLAVGKSKDAENYHEQELYIAGTARVVRDSVASRADKPRDEVIRVKPEILVGNPAEEIIRYASQVDAGLILLSTHGRSGMTIWSLGSVTKKVLRAATSPVLLVRAKGKRPDIRRKGILHKALIPLDGSKESEAVIPFMAELAGRLRGEVVLLQVLARGGEADTTEGTPPVLNTEGKMKRLEMKAREYLAKMAGGFRDKGITASFEVRVGNAAEEIIKFRREISADMVAMSTHGQSGISRWGLGSVADKVADAGYAPLLLVRVTGAGII